MREIYLAITYPMGRKRKKREEVTAEMIAASPCPDKAVCGSCGWSHLPYKKQLEQKLGDINGSFKLKGLDDVVCEQIIPSPETEHYRNRMDFVIDFEGRVGMRERGKWWRVLDGHTCFLADERIEALFAIVREWSAQAGLTYFDRKAHTGLLRYAVIRSTSLGETMVNVVTSAPADEAEEQAAREALENLAAQAESNGGLTTLLWSVNSTITDVSRGDDIRIVTGPGYIEEEVGGLRYRITPNAFFQTNMYGAPVLQDAVVKACGDVTGKTVMDLYCGSGFFAIAMAGRGASKVVGVEEVPEAITDARVNAELNGVQDLVEFFDARTEDFDWIKYGADVVIVDPPRAGMHDKALGDLLAARPKHLVYISCNYKNFARELVQIRELYDIQDMVAIDMFPHTPHVELVTTLVVK